MVKNSAPPPWTLNGKGHILVYKFSKEFIVKNGFLADYQQNNFWGFFGTVMIVEYSNSPVGPYNELLFVPGLFDFEGKKNFSISKIYVNNQDSVENGIENWGIPKEFADISFEGNDKFKKVVASKNDVVFFKADLNSSFFKFPISTLFFPLKLKQKLIDKFILTNSSAKGWANFSSIKNIKVNQAYFPDISQLKPILTLSVSDFEMKFPVPEIS